MDLRLEASSPGWSVPPGVMFGHPTRLVDCWTPQVERMFLPGFRVDPVPFALRVFSGCTSQLAEPRPVGRSPLRWARRRWTRARHLGRLVVDGRFDTDGNVAHLLDKVVSRVLAARRLLRRSLNDDAEVTLVLRARPSARALEMCETLRIPVLCTDAEVCADVVAFDGPKYVMRGLLARLYDKPFAGYTPDTPPRVYVARRGARALENEAEVAALLEGRGFVRVHFEDLTIPMQWSIMRNAREVVAVHGAALGSLVFQRRHPGQPPLRLVELFGAGYVVNMYRQYAGLLGASWVAVRGRITPEIVRDVDERGAARAHALAPTRIAPESLELALHHVARTPPAITRPADAEGVPEALLTS